MDQQLRATRLWLQKQFRAAGLQLEPGALERLVGAVQEVPDPEEWVHALIEEVESSECCLPDAAHAGQAGLQLSWGLGIGLAALLLPPPRPPRAPATHPAAWPRAASEARVVTPPLLEQLLATLEGRAAPQDPVQVLRGAGVGGCGRASCRLLAADTTPARQAKAPCPASTPSDPSGPRPCCPHAFTLCPLPGD